MKRLAILLVTGALGLAACSSGSSNDNAKSAVKTNHQATASKSSKSSEYGTASTTPATTATPATATATIKAGDTSLGSVATDATGKTLYLFANDQGTTSAVPASVLPAWPPLVATGAPVAGPGIDAGKLGTAMQPSGKTWVTYNGHLLYTFSGDTAPGQTNGQGLNNVWYAVSASGDRIG